MFHSNRARVEGGVLRVDRKFLTGMQRYVEHIDAPLVTVHPALKSGEDAMDMVEVPCNKLGFEVRVLDETDPAHVAEVREQVERSELVVGADLGADTVARSLGVPYILVLEYDLRTQMTVTTSQVTNPLRRMVRRVRCAATYYSRLVPAMRGAAALHCNGYPVFNEAARYNEHRVLYLDSRMSSDMVIPLPQLRERLAARAGRRVKMLFSGRYDPIKGAADSVHVALECLRRGMDIEMHCYGQGSQFEEMRSLASQAEAGRICVHDAISYPELVERSREFDIFVCCHIQSDPSCTYLESFGAGLPIAGYANRMWQGLSESSRCGQASPMGDPGAVADSIAALLADAAAFDAMSLRAREFAMTHAFEREFTLRTVAIQNTLNEVRQARMSRRVA